MVFSTDCFPNKENKTIEQALIDIESNAHKAAIASFLDISLNKYCSLTVAASSLAYARMKSSLTPIWPGELEELSGLAWKNLEKCLQGIQAAMKNAEKTQNHRPTSDIFTVQRKTAKVNSRFQDQENYLGKRAPIGDHKWRKVLGDLNFQAGQRTFGSSWFSNNITTTSNNSFFKL